MEANKATRRMAWLEQKLREATEMLAQSSIPEVADEWTETQATIDRYFGRKDCDEHGRFVAPKPRVSR